MDSFNIRVMENSPNRTLSFFFYVIFWTCMPKNIGIKLFSVSLFLGVSPLSLPKKKHRVVE